MSIRPQGSNADEWLLFLSDNLDRTADGKTCTDALSFVAVQIAEAIEAAEKRSAVEHYNRGASEGKSVERERCAKAADDACWARDVHPATANSIVKAIRGQS